MRDSRESRINRLRSARQKAQERINEIEASYTIPNKGFKISGLKEQVATMTRMINKLEHEKGVIRGISKKV